MLMLRAWSVRHADLLHRLYALGERAVIACRPVLSHIPASWLERVLRPVERTTKQVFFDCQMCGQCALSRTGMACPMNCPKQLRNGPCGGVRGDGGCEVTPSMRCVWLEAGDGMARIEGSHESRRILPVDRSHTGESTWAQILRDVQPPLVAAPGQATARDIGPNALRDACRRGDTVVTVELGPPDSADPSAFLARARRFSGLVDAINITDGAGGNCHMSSVAAAAILVREGFHAVAQITCRDRNRIAAQGDVLGANALGVGSFLCLTGDDVSAGDQPDAKRVFDLDAVNMVAVLAGMRDQGAFASGRKLDAPLDIFVGATCNPFAPPYEARLDNLERKIDAGAQFIQTQFCFDVEMTQRFMEGVHRRGLHRRATIILGVGMLASARGLAYMARHIPGIHVPNTLLVRISAADDQRAEGIAAAVEIVTRLRAIEGVGGFHLMGHRNEQMLVEIIEKSGIAPRAPSPGSRECA